MRWLIPILVSFTCFAQTQTYNPPIRFLSGTSAPSSGACDAAGERGGFYIQTGDPASVATQYYVCVQTGASSYAWMPTYAKVATTAPATCVVGNLFFDSDATAGSNLYGCTSSNTWTLLGGGSGSPGGSNTQVQFNDSGAFGGDSGLTYDKSTDQLSAAGGVNTGDGTVAGRVDLLELSANGNNYRRLTASDSLSTDLNVKFFEGTAPANNDCLKASVSGSTISIEGQGAACGSGSGGYNPLTSTQQMQVWMYPNCTLGGTQTTFWQLSGAAPVIALGTQTAGDYSGCFTTTGSLTNDLAQYLAGGLVTDYIAASNTALWSVRFRVAITSTTSELFRIGISDGSSGADGVYVRYDTAAGDTAFNICLAASSTVVCQTTTQPVDTNPHVILFHKVSATQITVKFDSTTYTFYTTAGSNTGTERYSQTFSTAFVIPERLIKTYTAATRTLRDYWVVFDGGVNP